jgi:Uma2 family endonuclease
MNAVVTLPKPRPASLTVADFLALDRNGAFERMGKVELIEGTIQTMSPQQRPHSFAKNELNFRLRLALAEIGSALLSQSEVTVPMPPSDVPEPDIVITSAAGGDGYIPLESIHLIVEIAYTTSATDLGRKRDLYAANQIPEYWVVELNGGVIHQFWSPDGGAYGRERVVRLGEVMGSEAIAGLVVETSGIV